MEPWRVPGVSLYPYPFGVPSYIQRDRSLEELPAQYRAAPRVVIDTPYLIYIYFFFPEVPFLDISPLYFLG